MPGRVRCAVQLHRLAVLADALQRPVPLQPCIADVRISWCAQCVCTQAGQCVPFCPSQLFESMQKTERKVATLQELQCMQHRNAALQDELKEAKLQQQKADAGLQAALEELQESCGLICALLLETVSKCDVHPTACLQFVKLHTGRDAQVGAQLAVFWDCCLHACIFYVILQVSWKQSSTSA